MSVTARKLKSGKTVYDARVFMGYTVDGKPDRRSVTCRTKRAAEIEEAKLLAEKDAMRNRSGRMPLASYIERRYWPVASKRLAATSKDTYEKELRLRIVPSLGKMDLRDIDRNAIQRMVDGIATESVARKCVGVLKTVLNEAKGDGLIMSNPAEATFAMPKKGRKRDNGLVLTTFDQIYGLLDIVGDKGSESVQRIAYTGLLQGLRPEERYALDWEDIDPWNGTIDVNSAYVAATPKHGGNQSKAPKTENGRRTLPMHPRFAEWLAEQERGDGPFITGADGCRISPSAAQKRWARFLRDNPEAPKVTIENMRHSFATSYLHAGGNVEDLSLMLGHSDINTTYKKYIRPNVGDLRRGMMAVSGL